MAVADVERSLAFYLDLLGPLGWVEEIRYPTYRGTEEVVYLARPGAIRDVVSACVQRTVAPTATTTSASSTSPSRLTDGRRLMRRMHAASRVAQTFTSRRRRIATSLAITRSLSSIPMGFESKCSAGSAERPPSKPPGCGSRRGLFGGLPGRNDRASGAFVLGLAVLDFLD